MYKSWNVIYGYSSVLFIFARLTLEKNLVDNGGILDRVHFVSQVRHAEDALFLTTIVNSNPTRYTFRDHGTMGTFGDYTGLWDYDIDANTVYIKIGINKQKFEG